MILCFICVVSPCIGEESREQIVPDPVILGYVECSDDGAGSWDVSVQGDHAYVVSEMGLSSAMSGGSLEVVDITIPSSPVLVATLHHEDGDAMLNFARSIDIYDNYAFIASNGGMGALEIVDITDPAYPVHAASLQGKVFEPCSVDVEGAYAYLACFMEGLVIVNVQNPLEPECMGSIVPGDHDINSVDASEWFACAVSNFDNTLYMVNVINPDNPELMAQLSDGTGGARLKSPDSVVISDYYAYVIGSDALEIVDISDPGHPFHAGCITNPVGEGGVNDLFVDGSYAYIVGQGGFAVIDVTDPANPKEIRIIRDRDEGEVLSAGSSVFVDGNVAYVTAEYGLTTISL
ncbi:MAG: hypothetical protein JXA44_13690 [Methanospirillaceae archaeon]|nr:hypothetical protein [Methanospirillaceae archaeon]